MDGQCIDVVSTSATTADADSGGTKRDRTHAFSFCANDC